MKISYLEATPRITKRGGDLATYMYYNLDLAGTPDINKNWNAIEGICSLICRNQETYQRIQEFFWGTYMIASDFDRKVWEGVRCERRIRALSRELSRLTGLDMTVEFKTNPKKQTVQIFVGDSDKYIPIPE